MDDGKIKYSDLIQDDGALQKLLSEISQVKSAYSELVKDIKKSAGSMSQALGGLSGATVQGRNGLNAADNTAQELLTTMTKLKATMANVKQAEADLSAQMAAGGSATTKSKAAMEQIANAYRQLKNEMVEYINLYKNLTNQEKSSPFGHSVLAEITKLDAQASKLNISLKSLTGSMKEQASQAQKLEQAANRLNHTRSRSTQELTKYNREQREANKLAKLDEIIANSKEGSYERISAQYAKNKIALSKLSAQQLATSESAQKLQHETYLLYQKMKQFQESTGVHSLSVGNYAKAWSGLGFSVQQVVRELPAVTIDMRTFFLAISNNIPILVDEINKVRASNKALAATGQPTVSVLKQVGKALFSWQSLLVVGITLLIQYSEEVTAFARTIFGTTPKLISFAKALKNISEELKSSNDNYGENVVTFNKLREEFNSLGTEAEKIKWLEKYKDELEQLGLAINSVTEAERLFNENSASVIEAFKLRAQSAAAQKLATDEYVKALQAESELKALQEELKLLEAREAYAKSKGALLSKSDQIRLDYVNLRIAALLKEKEAAEANAKTYEDLMAGLLAKEQEKLGGFGFGGKEKEGIDLTDRIYRARLQAVKKFEESETELIKNEFDKREEKLKASARAEIAALEEVNRKAYDWLSNPKYKKLTEEQKQMVQDIIEANNITIYNLEEKLDDDLYQLALDRKINTIKVEKATNDLKLQIVKKGSDDEYELRKKSIGKQRDLALLENKKLKGTGKEQDESVITAAYGQQLADVDNEKRINRANEKIAAIELRLQAEKKGATKEYELRRKILEKKRDLEIEQNKLLAKELQKSEADIRASYQKQMDELDAEEMLGKLNHAKQVTELELQVSKKGSDKKLELELRLLDDEEKIQLAQNEQLADNLKLQEQEIKDSYARRRALLKGQYAMEAFMAQQSIDRAKLASGDVKSYRKDSGVSGRNRRPKKDDSTKYSRVSDYNMQVFETEQAIAALNEQIKLAEKEIPEIDWSADEIAAAKAEVVKLKNELDGMTSFWQLSAEKGIGGGILTKLGFDDESIEAMQNAGNIIIEQISAIADAYVEAAEREVEAAKERVAAAQSAYDAEIEARNNGYANNVATAKAELQLEKRTQREKQKELEKAQKAQEAINTVTQISSLVTATAQLWASFASTGVAAPFLAAAAIAAMWGSFAFAKIKAAQIAKKSDTYGEGGLEFLQGGSHASGNDIDLGTTNSKGNRMRAEGGEAMAIINKRNTKKYRKILPSLIDSLNNGMFEEKYMNSLNPDRLSTTIVNSAHIDISQIENDVAEIKKQNEAKYYTADGYLVIQRKNVRQIIKN